MDTRHLNTMNHTSGKITRETFLDYLRVQESGKINMFGYNTDIQREDNYSRCYKWFIEKKLKDELTLNEVTGLVQFHLIEREDGTVFDPMKGFNVDIEMNT